MSMNPTYRKFLESKLSDLLSKVVIDNGFINIDSVFSNTEEFNKEADKNLAQHIGNGGSAGIIYDFCSKSIQDIKNKSETHGKLSEHVQDLEELKKSILDYLADLPHEFEIYLEVGKSFKAHFDSLEVIDGVRFVNFSGEEDFLLKSKKSIPDSFLSDRVSLKVDRVYLAIKEVGHISNDLTKKSVIYSLSNMKKILYLGYATEAIKINNNAFSFYSRGRRDVLYRNLTNGPNDVSHLELTSDFSEYAFKLDLNSKLKDKRNLTILGSLYGNDKDEVENLEFLSWKESYNDFFQLSSKLMAKKNDPIKVDPIKRATEWAFNALCTQDINLSFIQGCMALESLLGDDLSSKKSLHETLADRFAYMLGKDNLSRRKSREQFLEIYEMRSEIVHGSGTHIKHDKIYLRNWLNKVLEYLIKKELRSL